jgi:hypothetical protein
VLSITHLPTYPFTNLRIYQMAVDLRQRGHPRKSVESVLSAVSFMMFSITHLPNYSITKSTKRVLPPMKSSAAATPVRA